MTHEEIENFKEDFSDWDDYYRDNDVETMPWYRKNLDHDVENEIKSNNYNAGNFLDLGTGPGTQALELSKIGFKVTGTDISQSAIEKAKKLSNEIDFVVDDVLNLKLSDEQFDFIFDRGIFFMYLISHKDHNMLSKSNEF
ncbi:MAG: methyltransferase domain-containing protein [Nitrosopumilaceae archaeon]|nr:methyltransferase domain-containing protein [Nitrosopumilaceae archaeon]